MRTNRRPNLEKLIKNASDLLNIKEDPDLFSILPSTKPNLMFIRSSGRFLRPEASHKALTPSSKKMQRLGKDSNSPFTSASNSSFSPSPQNERAEKIHFMIDQLEDLKKSKRVLKLPELKLTDTSNVTKQLLSKR